jgi:hypothetical protein
MAHAHFGEVDLGAEGRAEQLAPSRFARVRSAFICNDDRTSDRASVARVAGCTSRRVETGIASAIPVS